jgi:diguanylate cyclase (GGDEF)-like protein
MAALMAKVLVVDDHAENRELLIVLLGYAGHESIEAGDGSEALAMVRQQRPDLVICDILMPTMDGYEFVRKLRADPAISRTEVIFYTATFLEREANNLAESCGVRYVLTKPCEPERILKVLENALGSAAEPQPPSMPVLPDTREFDREHLRLMTDKLVEKAAQLQAANQRLSALTELNLQLASERDPYLLLDKFCQGSRDLFASRCAILVAIDAKGSTPRHFTSWGIAADEVGNLDSMPFDGGVFAEVLARREPRRLAGPQLDRAALGLGDAFPRFESGLIAPLLSLQNVYGWIFLIDKIGFDGFSEEDERLLAIHAAQAGRIYENGSLYAKIQRHAAHLEKAQRQAGVQYAVASVLADAQTWDEAIAGSFAAICEHLQFRAGALLEIDAETAHVTCHAAWSSGAPAVEAFVEGIRRTKIDGVNGPTGRVWLDSEPYSVADIGAVGDFDRAAQARAAGLHAAVFVPVVCRGLRLGVLELFAEASVEPDSETLQTVRAIGAQIGQAMVRRRQQISIGRLNRVYAVLSGVNSLIVRVRDRAELFREACRIAVEDGQFRKVWIGVLDGEPPRLRLADFGGDTVYFEKLRAILGELSSRDYGQFVEKLRAGEPLVFNDVKSDPAVLLKRDIVASGSRAIVWLPLIVASELTGVLVLHADESGFFDADEMKLLLELAGDIAFAMEHIAKTDRLDYLAYFDVLTGLANATLFGERLDQRLLAAPAGEAKLAVAVVNVSRFKVINNAFGREIGDGLLKQVGARIADSVEDHSQVARLGGDNFALMLTGFGNAKELAKIVEERVLACFRSPFSVEGAELHCAGKVGIAMFPEDGADSSSLVRNAESAVGQVRDSGEPYLFHTAQMSERVAEALALESDLRRALEQGEFILHYQPKVDIDDRYVEGLEALIRWNSPVFGMVSPMQFVPLLEETGLIVEVGAWVWRRASLDFVTWAEQGLCPPRIAVNVSAVQLRRHDFVATISGFMKSLPDPAEIDIEITESSAMEDIAEIIDKLHALYSMGVNIAIDDFGTGHSTLSYLAKLPAHFLKIDRSFISVMLDDPDKMSLVSTIISLAHGLKLKVVAEGVDTQEQANMLRLLRCDQMQGYLIAKPMPFEEMTEYIKRRS